MERSLNSSETEKEKELKVQLKTVKDENNVSKRKVLSSEVIVKKYERQVEEIRSLCSQLNVSMKDKDCLRKDIHDIKEKYSIVEAKLVNVELELKSKTKEASNSLRNLKKKIKCRDKKLVLKNDSTTELKTEIKFVLYPCFYVRDDNKPSGAILIIYLIKCLNEGYLSNC